SSRGTARGSATSCGPGQDRSRWRRSRRRSLASSSSRRLRRLSAPHCGRFGRSRAAVGRCWVPDSAGWYGRERSVNCRRQGPCPCSHPAEEVTGLRWWSEPPTTRSGEHRGARRVDAMSTNRPSFEKRERDRQKKAKAAAKRDKRLAGRTPEAEA